MAAEVKRAAVESVEFRHPHPVGAAYNLQRLN
jgi:hypothetical protein